ncbi:MAG: hypothetical protein JCHSAcid_17060 [uncultured Acidilobus sp. JCHS]|nr:MAG: hypothetical protein JCHSAcid_17060 [uncultured Acidilobus sp. JCHS]
MPFRVAGHEARALSGLDELLEP